MIIIIGTFFLEKNSYSSISFWFANYNYNSYERFAFNGVSSGKSTFLFNATANFLSETKVYDFRFSTNYPFDIFIENLGQEKKYLLHNSPYIADDNNTIARLNGSYFLIYPNNSSIENLHFSLCKTETIIDDDLSYDKETVLADFSLDSSSPYYNSPLGDEIWYEVPYSSFPTSLTISSGQEYNWRLQYDLDGKTYFVDRNVVSLVDFSFNGSTRWR